VAVLQQGRVANRITPVHLLLWAIWYLEELTASPRMPPKYRPMVLLSSWCALRFGEITELRRRDLDLKNGVIHVRRGVTRSAGETLIGTPKSDAGTRDVAILPHLVRCSGALDSDFKPSIAHHREHPLAFTTGQGVFALGGRNMGEIARPVRLAAHQGAARAAVRAELRPIMAGVG
jgi:integrase